MKRTVFALALLIGVAPAALAEAQVLRPKRGKPVAAAPAPLVYDWDLAYASLAEADQAEVRAFYLAREGKPAWDDPARVRALESALGDAEKHGLDPAWFQPAAPSKENAGNAAFREVALTAAALRYARTLAIGRIDPKTVETLWEMNRNVFDAPKKLSEAVAAGGDLSAWFDGLAPQDKGYQGLTRAYAKYLDLVKAGGWPAFKPADGQIRVGDDDPRVPAIVARLVYEGDLSTPIEGTVYTPEIEAAVKTFQRRSGLLDDGVIGRDTQNAFSVTARDRMRQIAINLERRRWLPRELAPERIEVNVAAATLVYWRDGEPYDARRVVVGAPRTATPSLEKPFSSLVANPPWYVPTSIAKGEIFPREEREPGYMASQGMTVLDNGMIMQKAGPLAALGQVKFELVDSHAIYLHDTPAKAAFDRAKRHLSHGCVRVHDALNFARVILEPEPEALAEFDAALASGDTRRVRMTRTLPVRLLYWTAFVDAKDRAVFRDDVYGKDVKLAEALGLTVSLPGVPADEQAPDDVGP